MKTKESVHPDLQRGVRLVLKDSETDIRKPLSEGTSTEAMLEKARSFVTSCNGRFEDFCVYLSQRRVKSSCCRTAVKKTLKSSYMTPADFASFQQDPKKFPEIVARCKCGAGCGAGGEGRKAPRI